MSDSLGLSIGVTNLVALRTGSSPVTRQSVLTLFDHRAPEVGAPEENPRLSEPGLVLRGFVERVGDPVPLVASDGSTYRGETLVADALDAMGRTVSYGVPIAIAVPAHWGSGPVGALRDALRTKPALAPQGVPPALISDAAAALAALYADPGLPTNGVVALCDFGGSGTSLTLADGASNFVPISETVRYTDFSGEQLDQAILSRLLASVHDGSADPVSTAAVGSLTHLRAECRQAKEQLSAQTAAVVHAELPGFSGDLRLTRAELEDVISEPLDGFLAVVAETLERNKVPLTRLAAVAIVGGGASIPMITERISERLRVPVVTAQQPALSAAVGAATLAEQEEGDETATNFAAASDTPTSMAPAAWAAGAARESKHQSAADGAKSATFRALAWSQDDSAGDELVPYSGDDYTSGYGRGATGTRPALEFENAAEEPPEPELLSWYKRPPVLFGIAAALALAAAGGLAYTLTSTSSSPTDTTTSVTAPGEPSGAAPAPSQPPPPETVTVTGPDGSPTESIVPPPPSTTTAPPTTTTTTTTTTQPTTPPTTTTTQPPTTTTAATTTQAQTTTAALPTTAVQPVTPSGLTPPSGD